MAEELSIAPYCGLKFAILAMILHRLDNQMVMKSLRKPLDFTVQKLCF